MGYKQISTNQFDLRPAYIQGMEDHGLSYFSGLDCDLVGAQCAHCHTVVWIVNRESKILTEKRPATVPSSGCEYRAYYKRKLQRFLAALPPCPECGSREFDRFINNVKFPRLADGTPIPEDVSNLKLSYANDPQIKIWLYEED